MKRTFHIDPETVEIEETDRGVDVSVIDGYGEALCCTIPLADWNEFLRETFVDKAVKEMHDTAAECGFVVENGEKKGTFLVRRLSSIVMIAKSPLPTTVIGRTPLTITECNGTAEACLGYMRGWHDYESANNLEVEEEEA